MTDPALIERITRSLAYMLRHQPHEFDLELDAHGYGEIDEVVRALNERLGEPVERPDLESAITAGDRPRYEIVGDKVRALYGHSIPVEPGEPAQPPELLYVGLGARDADRALQHGLSGGRRRFLHLARSVEDARESGRRAGREYAVLVVRATEAWEEGVNFYDRQALFLSEAIPTRFIGLHARYQDGEDRRDERHGGERGGWPSRPREEAPRREFAREEFGDAGRSEGDRGERRGRRRRRGRGRRDERDAAAASVESGGPRDERRPPLRDGIGEERVAAVHDEPRRGEAPPRELEPRFEARRDEPREARHDDRRERGGYGRRDERPSERGPRTERGERADRSDRGDHQGERGHGRRGEHAGGRGHEMRPFERRRDERPRHGDRGERPARHERPGRHDRPERSDRPRSPEPARAARPVPAPAQSSADETGFGLGVFGEPERAPAKKPAPPREERRPAAPPKSAPLPPAEDDAGGFGAGL